MSRRGKLHGPVDATLAELGLERRVMGAGATRLGLARHPRHDADPAHAWLRRTVRELPAQWSAGRV